MHFHSLLLLFDIDITYSVWSHPVGCDFGWRFWLAYWFGHFVSGSGSLIIEEEFPWLASLFKVNSDAAWTNKIVGISTIVHDKNVEVMLVMESHFSLIGPLELTKATVMFHGISKTLEAEIFPLWVENSKISIWSLLIENARYANKVQSFVDAIRDTHLYGSILCFL